MEEGPGGMQPPGSAMQKSAVVVGLCGLKIPGPQDAKEPHKPGAAAAVADNHHTAIALAILCTNW
jgi:hypothetical protein